MKPANKNPARAPGRLRERGMSLLLALIALIAMALTGVALIRAVDTSNLIAGNFAFHNAALHASDVGVERAFSTLEAISAGSLESAYPSGCSTGCTYYPTMQAVDSHGIPTNVNWNNVPGYPLPTDSAYTVRYVIERLCSGTPPITDVAKDCYSSSTNVNGTADRVQSKKAGARKFSIVTGVYFRVTVRVDGPRNTIRYVQSIFSH